MKNYFRNKSILVTGATGSIGSSLVKYLRKKNCKVIRALSNDENSLYELSELINESKDMSFQQKMKKNKIRFILGDIRDYKRCLKATRKIDVVIHAAALKHVPLCEFNPKEAYDTNVIGTKNLVKASKKNKVEKFLFISTDKVVNPISIMGKTKLEAEKHILNSNLNHKSKGTIFSCIRFGNIIGSRGSVLLKFKKQILNNKEISLTNFNMQRYFLTIDKAINNICKSVEIMKGNEIFIISNLPIFKIFDLANVLSAYYKNKINYNKRIVITGVRSGERMNEKLFIMNKHRNFYIFKNLIIINDQINAKKVNKFYNLKTIKVFKDINIPKIASKKYILNYLIKNNLV